MEIPDLIQGGLVGILWILFMFSLRKMCVRLNSREWVMHLMSHAIRIASEPGLILLRLTVDIPVGRAFDCRSNTPCFDSGSTDTFGTLSHEII